jgi:Spy/CpxP family protein refolding chaperone
MKKILIVLGLVAFCFLTVTNVPAQGMPGFHNPPGPAMPPSHRGAPEKEPSLTPEQQMKFQELTQKFNEETAALKGSLLGKRLELQALWSNPKTEPNTIMAKEREMRDLQNQMDEKTLQHKLETRKLLTPEQISQFGQSMGMVPFFGHGRMMDSNMRMHHRRGPSMGMCPQY